MKKPFIRGYLFLKHYLGALLAPEREVMEEKLGKNITIDVVWAELAPAEGDGGSCWLLRQHVRFWTNVAEEKDACGG